MPALNFQARFARAVETGRKRCTIRAPRKREIRVGDTLHLFTGMRTSACRKLKAATCCHVTPITIALLPRRQSPIIKLNDKVLSEPAARTLARRDGHATLAGFIDFFAATHGLPFTGALICW
jgi:hypothetical protein